MKLKNSKFFWVVATLIIWVAIGHQSELNTPYQVVDGNLQEVTSHTKLPKSYVNPLKYKTVLATVTAYCPCKECCGKHADGITSTGKDAFSRGVAADPRRVPYGTRLFIPGYGYAVVDDTGAVMRNSKVIHIDVRFNNHTRALLWGRQILEVEVYE